MGHRTVKRVPLDFDWPLNKVWLGYCFPVDVAVGCVLGVACITSGSTGW